MLARGELVIASDSGHKWIIEIEATAEDEDISELNEFHLNTWIQGRRNEKLKIYGPEGVQMLTDGIELAYTKDFIFRNEHHGDFIAPLDIAGFNTQTIDLNNPVLIDDGSLKITAYSVTPVSYTHLTLPTKA